MVEGQEVNMLQEKSHLKSKKFVASAIWSLCWMVLLYLGIQKNLSSDVLLAMIYMNGLVQGLYLGGQSFVDAFVRRGLSQILSKSPSSDKQKDQ